METTLDISPVGLLGLGIRRLIVLILINNELITVSTATQRDNLNWCSLVVSMEKTGAGGSFHCGSVHPLSGKLRGRGGEGRGLFDIWCGGRANVSNMFSV